MRKVAMGAIAIVGIVVVASAQQRPIPPRQPAGARSTQAVAQTASTTSLNAVMREQCYANTCVGDVNRVHWFDPTTKECSFWFVLPCFPYRCDAASRACRPSCQTDSDCTSGATCNILTNQCAPWGHRCKDPWGVISSNAGETSCVPYKCNADACSESCDHDHDCYSGYACVDHHCAKK